MALSDGGGPDWCGEHQPSDAERYKATVEPKAGVRLMQGTSERDILDQLHSEFPQGISSVNIQKHCDGVYRVVVATNEKK